MTKPKQRRGFACMTPEKRREIAAKGGASTPSEKRSFSRNASLASEAGRKGRLKSRPPKVAPSAESVTRKDTHDR